MTTSMYPGATRAERERERMRLKHAKEREARAAAGPKTTTCKDCGLVIVITGTGRPPTRCPSCRVKAEAEGIRKRNERQKQRERVKAGEMIEDDDTPTVDPINIELGHKRVELLYDPLPVEDGGFRPGARFDTDAIVTCGRNFGGATVQPWVYPGMIFQVHPYGKEPTRYRVNQDYRMERVA